MQTGWRIAALVVLALAGAGAAGAQELSWSGTVQYSQGKYIFTETTKSWSFYTGFTVQGERARLSFGLPVIMQNSSAITFVGDFPLPTGGPDSEAVGEKKKGERVPMDGKGGGSGTGPASGQRTPLLARQDTEPIDSVQAPGETTTEVADPLVSGAVRIVGPRGGFLGLDLTAAVKIPVRDVDSGVGTGEWDYGLGLSAAWGSTPLMLFADVGWWQYGDLPGLILKDVVSYGVGMGAILGSGVTGLVSFSGSSGVMDEVSPPMELGGMLSIPMGDAASVNLGVGAGLSEASPDVSVSVGSRITLANGWF